MNNNSARKLVVTDGIAHPNTMPERVVLVNEAGELINLSSNEELVTQFAPISDRRFITSGALVSMQGSPSLSFAGSGGWTPCWLLDSAISEAVGGAISLPSWWLTYDILVHYVNAGAGSGNVQLAFAYQETTNDGIINSIASNIALASVAPAQHSLRVEQVRTGLSYAGGLITFNAIRSGAHTSDTLGNDIGLIGVEFVRIS